MFKKQKNHAGCELAALPIYYQNVGCRNKRFLFNVKLITVYKFVRQFSKIIAPNSGADAQ